jgi:hypothetical protein
MQIHKLFKRFTIECYNKNISGEIRETSFIIYSTCLKIKQKVGNKK